MRLTCKLFVLVLILGLAIGAHADDDLEGLPTLTRDEAALRKLLDTPIPKAIPIPELSSLYEEKYGAAQQLGLYGKALEIARDWHDALPPDRRIAPLHQLHTMNIKYGDRALGLKYGEELIRLDQSWHGRYMSRLSLAADYLDQYQLKRARTLMAEAAAYLDAAAAKPRGERGKFHLAHGRSALARLQSRFAMLHGKYEEGERLALAAFNYAQETVLHSRQLERRFQYVAFNQYVGSVGMAVQALKQQGRYYDAEARIADAVEFLRRENWLGPVDI